MSKLLALDQSSGITGWAVFDGEQLEAYGKIVYESSTPIEERLCKLKNKVCDLIKIYQIEEVILEDIQLQNNVVNNVQTFKTLAEVYGVLSEAIYELNIPQSAVLASSWKHTLGIKGANRAAQKKQAQEYVIIHYGCKPTQDECDAICIGTHKIKSMFCEVGFDWS